jgi:glycosyltransferase involved in cell wall biosynthesis
MPPMAGRDIMKIVTMQAQNMDHSCAGAYQKYMEFISGCLAHGWNVYHISPAGFDRISHKNLTHIDILRSRSFMPTFLLYSIQVFVKLMRLGRTNKLDYVIVFSPLEGLIGVSYKFFNPDIKLVVAFHGDQLAGIKINHGLTIKNMLYLRILSLIEKITADRSDLMIFVSAYDLRNVLARTRSYNADKAMVIYNNVNTPRVIELSKDEAVDLYGGSYVIGFVGHLFEKGKGLRCLIESFHIIRQKIPNSKLVIIGSGPDESKLAALVRDLGMENDVLFTGYQPNPLRYVKRFDLMVLPSMHEGFPLVILESLYVGTPVIGSDVGGIPEILGDAELLFEPGNKEQLAFKIIDILESKDQYNRICRLCSDRSKQFEFDWTEKMINALESSRNVPIMPS